MQKGKVVYLKPTWLAGVRSLGPYCETVPVAWKTILDWLDSGEHYEMPERGFGLTYDDPRSVDPENLRYAAGVEVHSTWRPEKGSPVSRFEFSGGTYSVLRLEGPYSEVGEKISEYRDNWVPRLGLRLDGTRPLLAIYNSDIRYVQPEDQVAEICLPVTTIAGE